MLMDKMISSNLSGRPSVLRVNQARAEPWTKISFLIIMIIIIVMIMMIIRFGSMIIMVMIINTFTGGTAMLSCGNVVNPPA